jgi:hypothetical protein
MNFANCLNIEGTETVPSRIEEAPEDDTITLSRVLQEEEDRKLA